ncbi:SDR family oxidoreductase [Protaetiibacter sp. SSC-01]|uniref:SDR family oxidoreductase n=1 Tax=Protaetiibacter sp. SSC-01 TaxID=2759943 RepID=UPI001656D279|nr:SDR family oxidoreductase [Protaetiibacter sp. SSC-01]QNO38311.1 SDR family oxidoreductase [Protaetiibacter sp. SSC-01]
MGPLFSLEGRRALVTGAGRGIGRALALGLAEAGARVAVAARSDHELAETVAVMGGASHALVTDLAEPGAPEALATRAEESLGGVVDIVVHAAGVQHRAPAEAFAADDWRRVLELDLTAPFLLSQAVGARQLEAGRAGSHIFIASISSVLGLPNIAAYSAAKSGLMGIVRSLSLEWSGRGIRVNAVGPGYIRTRLTAELLDDPERSERMRARIPMGRFGVPEDLVGPTVFLASDASAYTTGQLLMVDGGWTTS